MNRFVAVTSFINVTVISKNQFTFDDVGFVIVTTVYVGFGFHYFMLKRQEFEDGLAIFVFSLFTIWATDSGAYFIGRTMGKRKLWPEISPNKTIEGLLVASYCAAYSSYYISTSYPTY